MEGQVDPVRFLEELQKILKAELFHWTVVPLKGDNGNEKIEATAYHGESGNWSVTVAAFRHPDDGPDGEMRYDGAAANLRAGVFMHLPAELNKAMAEQAARKTSPG